MMPEQQENNVTQKGLNDGKRRKINTSEDLVWKYFKNKGYEINLGKFMDYTLGAPDFFITNEKESFWVEVKTERFTYLNNYQLNWFARHKDEKTLIAVVIGKNIKFFSVKIGETNA